MHTLAESKATSCQQICPIRTTSQCRPSSSIGGGGEFPITMLSEEVSQPSSAFVSVLPTLNIRIPIALPAKIKLAIFNGNYIQLDLVCKQSSDRASQTLTVEGGSLVSVNRQRGPVKTSFTDWAKAWSAVTQEVARVLPQKVEEYLPISISRI